jgi:endonuclease G
MSTFAIKGPKKIEWKADFIPRKVRSLFEATMPPGASEPPLPNLGTGQQIMKEIIGVNNLKDISYLEKAIDASKSVAVVYRSDRGTATGFLVSSNILMTNHHVFADKNQATGATVEFNYQLDRDGALMKTYTFHCDPDDLFFANEELDYAIVRVAGDPGEDWGFATLKPEDVSIKVNDKVNIVQHPTSDETGEPEPKQIAMNDNEVKYVDPDGILIQYITDTKSGSSGSPVFNDNWQVVALHHSQDVDEQSGLYLRNQGTRIDAILKDLFKNLSDENRNEILS